MRSYMNSVLKRGLYGLFIGAFISATAYFIFSFQGNQLTVPSTFVRVQYLASLFIGFYCAAISVVFDVEEWSLLKQTITHMILMIPYLPFAHYVGWMPDNFVGRIIFIGLFIIFYMILWLSFKTYWTKKAKELDEGFKRINID